MPTEFAVPLSRNGGKYSINKKELEEQLHMILGVTDQSSGS